MHFKPHGPKKDDAELHDQLHALLTSPSPKVKIDAIHCIMYCSNADDHCFHAMLEQSCANNIKVRAAAITNLGCMYSARNMHQYLQSNLRNPEDDKALHILENALDSTNDAILHAAVLSVKALGVLTTCSILIRLEPKMRHPNHGIRHEALRAYAFHLSYRGRGSINALITVLEDHAEDQQHQALAAMGIVSAGYGDQLAARLNQYPTGAVASLIKAGVTIEEHSVAENALIGLCMMAPRNLWPHREKLKYRLQIFASLPVSHYNKDAFVELSNNLVLWEQQICAWAIASHVVPIMEIRLAILEAYMD